MTEYLATVSYAAYPGNTDKPKRAIWLNEQCTQLKHDAKAVEALIAKLEQLAKKKKPDKNDQSQFLGGIDLFYQPSSHDELCNTGEQTIPHWIRCD